MNNELFALSVRAVLALVFVLGAVFSIRKGVELITHNTVHTPINSKITLSLAKWKLDIKTKSMGVVLVASSLIWILVAAWIAPK